MSLGDKWSCAVRKAVVKQFRTNHMVLCVKINYVSSSTTKPMLAGLGSNPGLYGVRLVTGCPSHGMAQEENVEYSIM
jgi:hypothetical protein